jgi:serine/threonine protein kinase
MKEKNSQMMKKLYYYICFKLLTEILKCVHYLHEWNTIHRDLKPANILSTEGINRRFAKLADFGLSVNHELKGQSHTQLFGNIKNMAPQVMRSTKYDMKSDIYSLGMIVEQLFLFDNKS